MKQLTLHFDSPAEDSAPRVVVTLDGSYISVSNLESTCRARHLIYLDAWHIDCHAHLSLNDLEALAEAGSAVAVGPAAPADPPLVMGAAAEATRPDGAAPAGPPVLHFTSFREAKLREARLSFFEKVLMHAKSLPW